MKTKTIEYQPGHSDGNSKELAPENAKQHKANEEKISIIKRLHYLLPGGSWRKIEHDVDRISDSIDKIKENTKAKWWIRIRNAVSPRKKKENAITIQQLEENIQQIKRKIRWMGGWGLIFGWIGGTVATTLLFSSFTGKFLTFFLEKDVHEEEITDADVIIVIADEKSSEGGHFASETLDPDSLQRLTAALQFSNDKNLPIMLAGASKETEAMKNTALNLGMAPDKIFIEQNAPNVKEKAINSRIDCYENGFKKPVLFTTAYKMKRTLCEFRRQGLNARPFAVSHNKIGLNKETVADAIEYNPPMVKAAFYEYLSYIWSGCVFESKK